MVRKKKKKRTGLPRTLKAVKYQRGRSKKSSDSPRKAMLPGKRLSKNRKVYWETRKNRSDKRKKKV